MKIENEKIKNICMLSTHGYFDPIPELGKTDTGGQVIYVIQLAKALSYFGIKVDIFTRWFDRSRKQIEPLPDCPNVRVIRISAGIWKFIPKEQIYDVLPELSENMIKFIRKHNLQYDLFHGHYVDAGIVALNVAKVFSKPSFFTSHSLGAWKRHQVGGDSEEMDKIFNFNHRIAEELRIFQSVSALAITSLEEKNKIEKLYSFRPPKVEFIPPGVDIDTFRTLKKDEKETEVNLPKQYIFVVGRLAKVKGHDLLLPAFLKVLEKFPKIHLVIGGGSKNPDDEEKEVLSKIKNFVKENRISENVHLIGGIVHENLPPYYRQAKLFILSAKYEPFGMTALEAMACETPVVISKFAGIQENLNSGKDCLKMNPFETEKYADSICKLLESEPLSQKLAEMGNETVQNNFSWKAIALNSINFYLRFLN